ncbi:MAG: hypothetical protein IKM08_06810, partial [Clostridia bacterium]|nr:hypothetical protein [Clostridia bacterium]
MDRSNCYHASATLAYRHRDLILRLILPDEESDLIDLFLFWQTTASGRLRMLPEDGITVDGEEFTVYAATLRADCMEGDLLCYSFGGETWQTATYRVPLQEAEEAATADDCLVWQREQLSPSAILPLQPRGRIYLSKGDLHIRFATAGEHPEVPLVYVRQGEAFCPYAVEPTRWGCYEAVVPYAALAQMQRLQYYIEVSGGGCTATYGSAKRPLSVRVIDNTGPVVTEYAPAQGQQVDTERPEIRVGYADISGVDTERSIFCLDGKNRSKAAEWGEKSLLFIPRHPLSVGEHTVELA